MHVVLRCEPMPVGRTSSRRCQPHISAHPLPCGVELPAAPDGFCEQPPHLPSPVARRGRCCGLHTSRPTPLSPGRGYPRLLRTSSFCGPPDTSPHPVPCGVDAVAPTPPLTPLPWAVDIPGRRSAPRWSTPVHLRQMDSPALASRSRTRSRSSRRPCRRRGRRCLPSAFSTSCEEVRREAGVLAWLGALVGKPASAESRELGPLCPLSI